MANIRVPADGNIAITGTISGSGNISLGSKTITLNTKDTYVYENIDVIVSASASVQAGTLSNEASSGVTYTPNTAASTILPAEGTLYINEGWYPNTSVTLAHMIPDDGSYTNAGSNQILSGYEAYDVDGKKLIGTIATVNPTFNGGDVTATATVGTITKPTATIASTGTFKTASTYGVTGTTPSGTDGTDYLTIDGTITKNTGSVTATATANRTAVKWYQNTAGHISKATGDVALSAPGTAATNTSAASSIDVTLTDNFAPLYIPIVEPTITGGTASASSNTSVQTTPKVTVGETANAKDSNGNDIDIGNFDISGTGATSSNGYVTFSATGNANVNGSVITNTTLTTTDLTITNAAGAIAANSDTVIREGGETTSQGVTTTISAETQWANTHIYRIPIVTPAGTGGGLTVNGGSITNLSGTAPSVTPSATGTFLPSGTGNVGETYGVTTSTPTTGTDGTNYVTITPSGTAGSGQAYTATVNLTYNRAAVTTDAAYKGAVSMASGATLLAAANNQNASRADVSVGSIQATVGSPSTSYYIPIVTPAASGGGLSDGSITCTPSGTFTITPKVEFASRSGSSESSMTNSAASTTYGIVVTGTAPTSGDYLKLDPGATPSGTPSVSASVTVNRAAITVSSDAGLTNGTGTGITSTSKTYTGSVSVSSPTIDNGTNFYIPVITVPSTSSVSNSVTNPTVDLTAGAAYGGTGAPSGSVSGFTSTQPSGAYVVITPGKNVTSGTVTSTVSSITINKGITAGGTISGGTDTDNIGVTNGTTTNYYVKIYDGTYTVA